MKSQSFIYKILLVLTFISTNILHGVERDILKDLLSKFNITPPQDQIYRYGTQKKQSATKEDEGISQKQKVKTPHTTLPMPQWLIESSAATPEQSLAALHKTFGEAIMNVSKTDPQYIQSLCALIASYEAYRPAQWRDIQGILSSKISAIGSLETPTSDHDIELPEAGPFAF